MPLPEGVPGQRGPAAVRRVHGGAVQVDPIKLALEAPGITRLKL